MLFSWFWLDPSTGFDFRINIIPAGDEVVSRSPEVPYVIIPEEVITVKEMSFGQADLIMGLSKTPQIKLTVNIDFLEDNVDNEVLESALCEPLVEKTLVLTGNTFYDTIVYETGTVVEVLIRYTSLGGTSWYKKFVGIHLENIGTKHKKKDKSFELTIDGAARVAVEAVDFEQITKEMTTGITISRELFSYYMLNGAGTESWECVMAGVMADNTYIDDYFYMANTADVLDALEDVATALYNAMTCQTGVGLFNTYPDAVWYKQSYGLTDTRGAVVPFNQLYSIMYTKDNAGEITGGLIDPNGGSSLFSKYGNMFDMLSELFEGTGTMAMFTPEGISTYGSLYPVSWGPILVDEEETIDYEYNTNALKLGQLFLAHWEFNEGDSQEKIFHYKGAGQNDSSYTIPVFVNNAEVIPDEITQGSRVVSGVKQNWYFIKSEESKYRGHYGNLFYYDQPAGIRFGAPQFFMVHPRPKLGINPTTSTDNVTSGSLGLYNTDNNFTAADKTPSNVHFTWQLLRSLAVGVLLLFGQIFKSRVENLDLTLNAGDFVEDSLYGNPWLDPHLGTIQFDCTQIKRKLVSAPYNWRIQESVWDVQGGSVKVKHIQEFINAD